MRSLDITFPEDVDLTRQNGQQYSFHFCHKVGVNRLSKEAGLIPHNENTPLRGGPLQDAGSQTSILQSRLLAYAGRNWPELGFLFWSGTVLMKVRAAQKWNFIEHLFLEPFEPEINHRRHEQRDQLRKNESADNDKPKGTA